MRHQHLINSRRTYKTRFPAGKDIPKTLHVPPSRFRTNFYSKIGIFGFALACAGITHHATIIRFSLFQYVKERLAVSNSAAAKVSIFLKGCSLSLLFFLQSNALPLYKHNFKYSFSAANSTETLSVCLLSGTFRFPAPRSHRVAANGIAAWRQRRLLRTTFQIRTSRRRCAKPLVGCCAFCPALSSRYSIFLF